MRFWFYALIKTLSVETSGLQFVINNWFCLNKQVFDGHGGKGAAQFVRDHLPRVIVDDSDFPLELEKVVTRSFMETDAAFARSCTLETSLSSGTTALTAMIFGR